MVMVCADDAALVPDLTGQRGQLIWRAVLTVVSLNWEGGGGGGGGGIKCLVGHTVCIL